MSFFKKPDPKEWEKKQKEAEDYNKKELEHTSSVEGELTAEKLEKIALAKKNANGTNSSSTPK